MPHVSRKKLPVKIEDQLIEALNWVINALPKKNSDQFLDSLLTKTEKLMLAKRLAVAFLIKENKTDREISETLNITRITVAKLRAEMDSSRSGFYLAINKLSRRGQMAAFKELLLKLGAEMIRNARIG